MKIIIDPRFGYRYETFYLEGVKMLFGKGCVSYDIHPFLDLKYETRNQYNSGTPLVVEDELACHKIFIDTEDRAKIEEDRYEWCDVYAKVNAAFGDTIKYRKMLVLGPAFGIRIQSLPSALWLFVKNMSKSFQYTSEPFKSLLQSYLYPYIRRRSLSEYERPAEIKPNYIFHASTLWYNEFAWTCTNKFRGEFLRACQKAGVEIEGGLFYLGESPAILSEMPDYGRYKTEYKDFIYESRLSMDDYIRKTKESFVVFNTPSVCECHGWKLAEYLCMGKAIISTPLTREMPGEGLVHGKNVHFVHTMEDIYDAVVRIRDDADYRLQLEKGARKYYEEYLAPEVVIKRIVSQVHGRTDT